MKQLINIIITLCLLLGIFTYYPAKAQQTLDCEGTYFTDALGYPGDVTIPDTDVLSINIKGGDGGGVKFSGPCNTHIQGGTGARVEISFSVGHTGDALRPGGTLRLYQGLRGGTREPHCINAGEELSGGGGGATAILYLPPDGVATEMDWILLAVAGGGGGATRPGPGNTDKIGGGGRSGKNGGNSGYSTGGTNQGCPESQSCIVQGNKPGVGAGFVCNEGNIGIHGKDMFSQSTSSNGDIIKIKPRPNDEYVYTIGFGDGSLQENGGAGFFGGGGSGKGGGGGGGFYGGGVYCQEGGGGGGSWACTAAYGAYDLNITAGVAGGAYHYPNHGTLQIVTAKNPASASCSAVTVELDATGNGQFVKADYLDNSSSPCNGSVEANITDANNAPLNGDVVTFKCTDIGQTFNIAVTVLDDGAQSIDACTASLTVVDVTAPAAATNANHVLNLDANGNATLDPDIIDNSTDNCGIATKTLSQENFTCSDVGTKTITLTVTDDSGNSSTADAVITITDLIAPNAQCQNVTIPLDATGNISIAPEDIDSGSNDACGIASMLLDKTDFNCLDIGDHLVTLAVSDVNDNTAQCTATVTIVDDTAPNAMCKNINLPLDASGNASISTYDIDNGSNDACATFIDVDISKTSFDCTDLGANTVTMTLTDEHNNVSSCQSVITVIDNIAPDAQCQDVVVEIGPEGYVNTVNGEMDNGSSDACGIKSASTTKETFTCADVGVNHHTYTVTDFSNNSASCDYTVTVLDNTPPVAICKDVTVWLSASGNAGIAATAVDNNSSDVCGVASIEVNQTNFDCSHVGTNTVTLTVTDVNSNTAACDATVTLVDNTSPDIVCQDMTVYLDATGEVSLPELDYDNGSSDICGIQIYALSRNKFYCTDIGANPVVYTVTDVNGNSSSCNTTITVLDEIAPIALCKNSNVEIQANGWRDIQLDDIYDAVNSSDNCGIVDVNFPATGYSCDEIGNDFTIPVTVTDQGGNVHTCYGQVTIVPGTDLPDAWQSTDLGNVTVGNDYEFDACANPNPEEGMFTVTGSGNNATGTHADHVAFAHHTLCGDGTITAKVESVDPNGYGGLMIRETADAGAKQTSLFTNLTQVLRHETRYTTNSLKQVNSFFKPSPVWLRLKRQGDWIFAYSSTDGTSFQYVHGVLLPMQDCVEIGLASFTYMPNAATTATFSYVNVSAGNGSFAEGGGNTNDMTQNKPVWESPLNHHTIEPLNHLTIFPNPAKDFINISIDEPFNQATTFQLYNAVGKLVGEEILEVGGTQLEWNVGHLPSGMYLLSDQSRAIAKPVVISR